MRVECAILTQLVKVNVELHLAFLGSELIVERRTRKLLEGDTQSLSHSFAGVRLRRRQRLGGRESRNLAHFRHTAGNAHQRASDKTGAPGAATSRSRGAVMGWRA
jgi:hypothetical protein